MKQNQTDFGPISAQYLAIFANGNSQLGNPIIELEKHELTWQHRY